MSQSGCQKTSPTLCPNQLSTEYQSPRGAQETDSGLQDLLRMGGPGRHPRLQSEMLESSLVSGKKVGEGC